MGIWGIQNDREVVCGMALSSKQKAWIDYYKQGHTATDAARLAGYKAKTDNSFQSIGTENLRKLAEYIKDRDALLESPRIATMEEVNAFWTATMRDKSQEMKDRLKASEMRARAAGGFVDKMQVDGKINTGQLDNVLKQLRGDVSG